MPRLDRCSKTSIVLVSRTHEGRWTRFRVASGTRARSQVNGNKRPELPRKLHVKEVKMPLLDHLLRRGVASLHLLEVGAGDEEEVKGGVPPRGEARSYRNKLKNLCQSEPRYKSHPPLVY